MIEIIIFTIITIVSVMLAYNLYDVFKLPTNPLLATEEFTIPKNERKEHTTLHNSPWFADKIISYDYRNKIDENTLGKTMFHDDNNDI
jgi:hypothetical protein